MIRRTYVPVQRENMRGGEGAVTINNWMEEDEKCPNLRVAANLVLPRGSSVGMHKHEGEAELFHVLSGKAEYSDNGKTEFAGPGDVMICYNGQEHSIKNVGEEDLVVNAIVITE